MLQTIPGGLWLPAPPFAVAAVPSFASILLDAASERAAFILRAPKTGNLRRVWWRTGTVTTGATLDVRIETVDLTTGFPSGTLFGASANAGQVVNAADDNLMFGTQLTADAAVTAGDYLAIVIANPAAGFGNLNVACFDDDGRDFPYSAQFTAAWAVNSNAPVVALEYSDGSVPPVPGCFPIAAINTAAFGNAANPDERGLRFRLPFPARLAGCWIYSDLDADYSLHLYGSDGATRLLSLSCDATVRGSAGYGVLTYLFASGVVLARNAFYRLALEPTTAGTVVMSDFDVASAALLDAFEGGQDFHYTAAKDPSGEGSWTQTLTRRPFLGILLDAFDDGTSAAPAARPTFGNGFN
jgi:hypothetical protein